MKIPEYTLVISEKMVDKDKTFWGMGKFSFKIIGENVSSEKSRKIIAKIANLFKEEVRK